MLRRDTGNRIDPSHGDEIFPVKSPKNILKVASDDGARLVLRDGTESVGPISEDPFQRENRRSARDVTRDDS
jgi:hypothetical protein